MSEPLENEIEEELRKKQLKALWDRFGLYLIAVILIIIMSFGGYEFSKYLGYKNSESASDQYEKALAVLDNENNNDAINIFESLVNESNGYSGLSLFNLSYRYRRNKDGIRLSNDSLFCNESGVELFIISPAGIDFKS